jgi:hypothetical protein
MALLKGQEHIELLLKPYKLQEKGQPTWILTQLEFKTKNNALLSTTFSLTEDNLGEIIELLKKTSVQGKQFSYATMDANFVLEFNKAENEEDIIVSFWYGDLYDYRTGYQFTTTTQNINNFINELENDQKNL